MVTTVVVELWNEIDVLSNAASELFLGLSETIGETEEEPVIVEEIVSESEEVILEAKVAVELETNEAMPV